MYFRAAMCVLVSAVLVGCGGDRSVAFGSAGKPLLERLKTEAGQKSDKQVDQIQKLAQNYRDKQLLRTDEHETLSRICEYMKKGEWESAQKLIESCLAETNRGTGMGGGTTESAGDKK